MLPAIAFALPTAEAPKALVTRQSSTTCGNQYYSSSEISDAANAACNYVQSGDEAGSSTYPHQYNDYEGFSFPDSGPYYEFPILSSGNVYSGGSPGPDRVIVTADCYYEGAITHTGASGNNFVGCSGTS